MEDKRGSNGRIRKTNLTDPDSMNTKSGNDGALQGYIGLSTVDSLKQVIVNASVTGDSEPAAFQPLVQDLLDKDRINNTKLLADAGFHSGDNLEYCANTGINAYMADGQYRKRDPRFSEHQDKKPKQRKRQYFGVEEFEYDAQAQRCWCPAGKEMWLSCKGYKNKGVEYVRFVGYLKDCSQCHLKAQCMRREPRDRGRQVSIRKDTQANNNRAIERMKRKIDTPEGRVIYSKRIGIVEPVFAHMKHVMGLDWFSLRGLNKVTGQWYLFCTVHNLVKIQNNGGYA